MAVPASRDELKDFCLRQLGFPVIQINVDDDQTEDCIDAGKVWWSKGGTWYSSGDPAKNILI